jgi:hypothetical protein
VRQRTDRTRLRLFLRALGRRLRRPVRFYLVGGSVMIDLGLRAATLDVDYVADADDSQALDDLEQAIRLLKNELDVNVEPSSPADFLPIPPGSLDRSRYVVRYGPLSVYYYHLPSLVIAKAARAYEQDLDDAVRLLQTGEVGWHEVEETWAEMRSSPTGWLRYEPADVDRRLDVLRQRLESQP